MSQDPCVRDHMVSFPKMRFTGREGLDGGKGQ